MGSHVLEPRRVNFLTLFDCAVTGYIVDACEVGDASLWIAASMLARHAGAARS
jgi:hypothetical protein